MITHFKSGLNQIKAEDNLVNKTEMYLRETLTKNQKHKEVKFFNLRSLYIYNKLAIAICLVVLLIGGSSGAYAYYQTPISYISVDINPSVELGVNKFLKVVKAEGYNDDGKKILNGTNVKGYDVAKAVNTLISSAVNNGFIANDGSSVISLTSETDNMKTAAKLESDAENGANEALNENGKTAFINKDNVALICREEARTLGITPGKLNIINKLQSIDPTVTVDQYKDASIKNIMKEIQNKKDNSNGNVNDKDNNNSKIEIKGNVNNKVEIDVNDKDNGNSKIETKNNVNNKVEIDVNDKEKSNSKIKIKSNVNNKDKDVKEKSKQIVDNGIVENDKNSVENDKNSVDNGSKDNGNNSGGNGSD